ncbi:unnamed protein product [Adineta steineri]|uniref:PCIF1 WW domain-containing protein n=1 Tax=Adineta steineri TaxID=433720 RepID=A0A814WD33_9BILA|nr:unnamed protein product [Adineta steineri]
MVAPNINAKSIPDVWDGYYRITFVQFYSETSPEKMREQFESFPLTSSNVPLLQQPFQVRRIGETPDSFWLPSDSADEPISLFVTRPIGFPLNLVLEKIKGHINQREWIKIPEHLLHMNIKFYSNTANKNWTWQKIKQHGIPEKVRKHTIQFHHTTLEIIPSRETCTKTYDQKSGNPWWIGVTELERKCSGCQYPVQNQWKGDEAVTLSSPPYGKLIYRDDSQEDFAGLAQRYGSKYYNAAYALGLRYSYLRLTGHGLARAYKEDTKRDSKDSRACEGFASAFNHYFDRYYSAFHDLEADFGSRGCFFKIKWEEELPDMTYYLCPPFDESLMQLCVDHVFNALEKRLVLRPTFVFSIPGSWTNFSALEQLKASTWVRTLIDYPKGKLPFIDYMATREKDRIIYPTDICVITLSDKIEKRKADCIDSEYSDHSEDVVAIQPIQKKRRNEIDEGNKRSPQDTVVVQPIQKKRRNETDEGNKHNPEDVVAIQSIQKKRRHETDEGNEHSPKDTVTVQPIQKKRRNEIDEGNKDNPKDAVAVQPIQKKRRHETDEGNEHSPKDTVTVQPIQKKRRNEIDEGNKQNPDDICGTEKIQLD